MADKKLQKKNNTNIYLNEYFNVFVFLLVVIIFIAAYLLFLGPKFKETKMAIEENISAQKMLYSQQQAKLEDLKTIKEVYKNILPSDINKFDQILPEDYMKESLYGEIEEMVIKNGFILGSVQIEEIEEEEANPGQDLPNMGAASSMTSHPNIGQVIAHVSISAIDYAGLEKMLRTFESSARFIDVQSVDFSQGDNVAEIEIKSYYYKNKLAN